MIQMILLNRQSLLGATGLTTKRVVIVQTIVLIHDPFGQDFRRGGLLPIVGRRRRGRHKDVVGISGRTGTTEGFNVGQVRKGMTGIRTLIMHLYRFGREVNEFGKKAGKRGFDKCFRFRRFRCRFIVKGTNGRRQIRIECFVVTILVTNRHGMKIGFPFAGRTRPSVTMDLWQLVMMLLLVLGEVVITATVVVFNDNVLWLGGDEWIHLEHLEQ
jgi:hypothetical protein